MSGVKTLGFAGLIFSLFAGSVCAQDILGAARSGDASELARILPKAIEIEPEILGRPLYFASQRGHAEAVAVLLDRGADPNTSFSFGGALHSAARAGHADVVTILLEYGADTATPAGEFDNTALHEAAEAGATKTASLLLESGANVNARNKEDQPPLHLALRRDRSEMAALLRNAGASPRSVRMPTQNELEAAAADPDAGWLAAGICRGCHELEPGEELYATYPGPTLLGIVGRPKASIETFEYSEAMRAQEGAWTLEELNQFLGDVYGTVPGTRMYNFPPNMTKEERTGVLSILLTLRAE